MVAYYGDFAEDDTVNIPFNTFDSNDPQNSVTATDLIASDIYVHKDGSATPITTDGATIDIDINAIAGSHMITIDTSVDAAYTTGSEYSVRVEGVTVDAGTVNAWVGSFSIERAGGALALLKGATGLAAIDTVVDGIQTDLDNGTDGLGALKALIDTVDTVVDGIQTDLDNGTDGLGAIKAETALILADTNELQTDNVPGLIATAQADLNTITDTDGVILGAAGVDLIWDEVLSAGTHNVANSAGKRIRDLQESGAVYGGFIWIDTNVVNTNTDSYVDGTSDNPVSTIAAANTLASALSISRFRVAPNSSITFAVTQANQEFIGANWTLALGSQNVAGTYVEGATITGIGTGSDYHFHHCHMGTCTLADGDIMHSSLGGTLTMSAAGDYYLDNCYSAVAGSGTPVIDFGAAVVNSNLSMRHYSGGIQIDNKDNAGTDNMSLEGNGQLVVAASSGGAISVRGNFKVTNTGSATITYDDNTTSIAAIEADTNELQGDWVDAGRLDTILDSILDDTDLIDDGTSGLAKIATDVDAILTDTGTTIPGTITTLQADTDDIQTRLPAALVSGKMDSDVTAINSNTTAAAQLALSAEQIESGQCEGTPSTTIIQTDLAETQDDIYIGRVVIFTSGSARGEATDITDYTGSTGTLTVTALANAPAATDTFILL
jgi:hypothetical protein